MWCMSESLNKACAAEEGLCKGSLRRCQNKGGVAWRRADA
jgi:hypothetical protein